MDGHTSVVLNDKPSGEVGNKDQVVQALFAPNIFCSIYRSEPKMYLLARGYLLKCQCFFISISNVYMYIIHVFQIVGVSVALAVKMKNKACKSKRHPLL